MVEIEPMDPAQEFEARLLLRHKAMNEATDRGDSAVQQFYNGATVFVTGGSGFLGKQLIEKLFRATQVSKVYILMRPKKGKPIEQRLTEMLQDPVYDMLKEKQSHFREKIVPVAGDVADLRLGLSEKDWNMITEEVNIIYHMAATTRFDEALRVATMINVRGAREALVLGKACKQLKSYVHVSTAYSHACENLINTEVLEDFYPSPVDPETLIRLAETVDEQRLNDITPNMIKNWPNTYSFAKAVAEETVRSMCDDLPLCVVRPAIVTSARKEPNPGWIDMSNVYGASGLILGPGLGLMHTMLSNNDIRIGVVPVDYVNNAIIVAAWETAKRTAAGGEKPRIYTLSTTRNPVLWGDLVATAEGVVKINYPTTAAVGYYFVWRTKNTTLFWIYSWLLHLIPRYIIDGSDLVATSMSSVQTNYPTPAAVGYCFFWRTANTTLFWIYSWLLHLIPGYIIDGICLILGKERRFVKLYRKMYNLSTALSYFTINEWYFVDNNTANLYNNLSTIDKEIFDFDVCKIDWREYMIMWCLGLRKYIVKDGLKSSLYAKKKQFVFKILTFIFVPLYFYLLFKVLSFAVVSLFLFFRMF